MGLTNPQGIPRPDPMLRGSVDVLGTTKWGLVLPLKDPVPL